MNDLKSDCLGFIYVGGQRQLSARETESGKGGKLRAREPSSANEVGAG